jgi:hypothetical protein
MVGRIHVMARTFTAFWVIIFVALAPAVAQEPAPLSPPSLDQTAHLQILATHFRDLALIYDGEDAFDWRHDLDLQRLTSLTWEVHRKLLTKVMLHTIHAKLHPTYIKEKQELDQVRAAADRHANTQLDLQELSDHVANLEIQLSITEQDLDLQDDVTSMLTRDIERHIAHRQASGRLPDHIRAYHSTLNLLLADIL